MFLFPFNFFLFSVQNEFVVRLKTLSLILHGEAVIENRIYAACKIGFGCFDPILYLDSNLDE